MERLPQLSREELEDLLEAQLQEIQSRNETNTNETIDIDDLASNYTEGYDAENSTAGYNDTVGYNTTTATEPPEEEKSGSKSGTFSKGSKTAPFRAHEEGIGAGRSRPCPHFLDFSCSEPLKKLKKLYQKLYATTERPTTMLEEGSEPATTEPSEIEPASTEPSGTTEPEPASTMEPNSEPTVTSRLQGTMLSYMYAQVRRPEHNMVQVQTPHTRTTVVYIPLNRNGRFGMRHTQLVCK